MRLEVVNALMKTALQYKARVLVCNDLEIPKDLSRGPMIACGHSFRLNAVVCTEDLGQIEPQDFLHELVHLVLGPSSRRADEGYALMPFEWALANFVAIGLPNQRERKYLLREVNSYQQQTAVGDLRDGGFLLEDYRNPRTMPWWHEGEERAIELGLLRRVPLDKAGTMLVPTFQRASYPKGARRFASESRKWTPPVPQQFL